MSKASEAEVRKLARNLCLATAFALILATATTLVIFNVTQSIPASFLSDLVNLNAILVAATAFLIPHGFQASKLNNFAEDLWKSIKNPATPEIDKTLQRKFLAKTLYIFIVVPLVVVLPFFVSAVIALVAILGYQMVILAEISFWVMLFFFLVIVIVLWQIAVFVRTILST